MTTTVIVHPSAPAGFKVEVTVGPLKSDELASVEYLKRDDPQKSYYVTPDMAVMVKEVPDSVPECVGSADSQEKHLVGAGRCADVYTRSECLYHYCPDPENCKESNACQCPAGNHADP